MSFQNKKKNKNKTKTKKKCHKKAIYYEQLRFITKYYSTQYENDQFSIIDVLTIRISMKYNIFPNALIPKLILFDFNFPIALHIFDLAHFDR